MSNHLKFAVDEGKIDKLQQSLEQGSPFCNTQIGIEAMRFEQDGKTFDLYLEVFTGDTKKENGNFNVFLDFKLKTSEKYEVASRFGTFHTWQEVFELKDDKTSTDLTVEFETTDNVLRRLLHSRRLTVKAKLLMQHDLIVYQDSDNSYLAGYGEPDDEEQVVTVELSYLNERFVWKHTIVHDDVDEIFQTLNTELAGVDYDDDAAITSKMETALNILERPNLVIDITGGVIQDAISTLPINMLVLDGELDGIESELIKTIDDEEYHCHETGVRQSRKDVMSIVEQLESSKRFI